MRNIAGKKRVRQEDEDSDYLFANSPIVSAFCVWVVFFKLIGCYKMAPRLIQNRPGPVRCSECLVQCRYVAAAGRPGKRRLWVRSQPAPAAQRLSFWLWQ